MATGYTYKVEKGETTFEEFVWECSRAFLIHMRDDTGSAKIRLSEHSGFYEERLNEALAEIKILNGMTAIEAEDKMKCEDLVEIERYEKRLIKAELESSRYLTMIKRTEAWTPSKEHEGLKKFMLEQLNMSLLHVSAPNKPVPNELTGIEYLVDAIKYLEDRVADYRTEIEKESIAVDTGKDWILDLHDQIPCPEEMKGF